MSQFTFRILFDTFADFANFTAGKAGKAPLKVGGAPVANLNPRSHPTPIRESCQVNKGNVEGGHIQALSWYASNAAGHTWSSH